ncbi:hypothetical protein Vretimale_11293 [Volvox reticuliferus]|uniref:Fe-S metabolism associated domain-containing protein n=1 Tax=Volvox reticuliferus TaxID=1737510 RepID=A0A8J4FT69_9CHLO|nr:hypothetical protein Vretifemale_12179 [Volvox reticuliferus]GIM07059.1 hypothetical protein Vretimale_11293 [Volvox reticuliferus]
MITCRYFPTRNGVSVLSRGFAVPVPTSRMLRRQLSRGVSTCRAQKSSGFPPSLQKIVVAFQMVPDPKARYKQLLYFATKLDQMPAKYRIPENKVEGCVSQVWVAAELRPDGKIYWLADSDSQLTKGLAALLVSGLSGCSPVEILSVQPTFIELLGLKQSLTPSRNNGFLNMFHLMQRKTLELAAESVRTESELAAPAAPAAPAALADSAPATHSTPAEPAPAAVITTASSSNGNSAAFSISTSSTPVQDSMQRKLVEALRPTVLNISNDSAQHAGHASAMAARHGKAGESGETHFRVEVVSEAFEGMSQVKRQRMIYQLLEEEFAMGLHALSLITRTPAEAQAAALNS